MRSRTLDSAVVFFILIAGLGLAHLAWSQEVTAGIVGTITDPTGAPIKDATVTATDVERGTAWTSKTNESGAYSINHIPVGIYTVEITAQGFQRLVHPPFALVLNQTARCR